MVKSRQQSLFSLNQPDKAKLKNNNRPLKLSRNTLSSQKYGHKGIDRELVRQCMSADSTIESHRKFSGTEESG